MRKKCFNLLFVIVFLLFVSFRISEGSFRFTVTSDMRDYSDEFQNICKQITKKLGGPGIFHISVGDIDPPSDVYNIITSEWGTSSIWYPVVGNHEVETTSDMDWIRNEYSSLPYIVNPGPTNCETTTYSFEYENAHFVVLNEYYDGSSDIGTDGDIVDALYNWIVDDLNKNTKPIVFVFGHEPAYPQPDTAWGDCRHYGDSLDKYPSNRDRFWNLLEEKNVVTYFCGHTHRYSRYRGNGKVWQVDCGQARGQKYDAFLNVTVNEDNVIFDVYRDLDVDGDYSLFDRWNVSLNESKVEITVVKTSYVTATIRLQSGEVKIDIPQNAFSEDVVITLSTTTLPVSNVSGVVSTGIGVGVLLNKSLSLLKKVVISFEYQSSDITHNENNLYIARYDENSFQWIPLISTVYSNQNRVEASTTHLSKFQIMEKIPSSSLDGVIVYPNPYKVTTDTKGITFSGLTEQADIKIFTISGELVKEIKETNGDGIYLWPVTNNKGEHLASGVYIYVITNDKNEKKTGKIAVIK